MASLVSVALIWRMKTTTSADKSAPHSAEAAPMDELLPNEAPKKPCGSTIRSTPPKPKTTAPARCGPTVSPNRSAASTVAKIGITKLNAVTSASGRRVTAAKFRNSDAVPVRERLMCNHGRVVRTNARGPWVKNDTASSGNSAKNPRKNATSPTGTFPASLMKTYMRENVSVAPSLSAMPMEECLTVLQPSPFLEPEIGDHGRDHHQDQRDEIARRPVQLGHDMEIHSVDRRDQRRRQEYHRRNRHDLDDVVLLVVDEPKRGVLKVAKLG